MTIHLIKLCVGVSNVQELADWQDRRLRQTRRVYHLTRMVPKRAAELTAGGSRSAATGSPSSPGRSSGRA
jgi:hypothetical protein